MALMKLQIQVLQSKTSDERTATTSSTDSKRTLDKYSATPNLPVEEDDDEATEPRRPRKMTVRTTSRRASGVAPLLHPLRICPGTGDAG